MYRHILCQPNKMPHYMYIPVYYNRYHNHLWEHVPSSIWYMFGKTNILLETYILCWNIHNRYCVVDIRMDYKCCFVLPWYDLRYIYYRKHPDIHFVSSFRWDPVDSPLLTRSYQLKGVDIFHHRKLRQSRNRYQVNSCTVLYHRHNSVYQKNRSRDNTRLKSLHRYIYMHRLFLGCLHRGDWVPRSIRYIAKKRNNRPKLYHRLVSNTVFQTVFATDTRQV